MGLIRKGLFVTTGVVAPYSKKQKTQMQILAAMQGATPEEVRKVGSRSTFGQPLRQEAPVREPRPGARDDKIDPRFRQYVEDMARKHGTAEEEATAE
jgi:hypothetical protein